MELWQVCAAGEDKGESVLNVPYPVRLGGGDIREGDVRLFGQEAVKEKSVWRVELAWMANVGKSVC